MMMRAKVGAALLWAAAAMGALASPAFAQNKELSDKSVLTLMRYAWGMVPEKFTTPLGKTILVISHDDRYYHLGDRIVKLEYGTIAEERRPGDLHRDPTVEVAK